MKWSRWMVVLELYTENCCSWNISSSSAGLWHAYAGWFSANRNGHLGRFSFVVQLFLLEAFIVGNHSLFFLQCLSQTRTRKSLPLSSVFIINAHWKSLPLPLFFWFMRPSQPSPIYTYPIQLPLRLCLKYPPTYFSPNSYDCLLFSLTRSCWKSGNMHV